MKKRLFACIDLFAGAGGLSIGLHRAGFDVKFAFDSDKDAVTSYNSNPLTLTPVARCMRIEETSADGILRMAGIKKGECALIAGGPPCQGFSIQRIGEDADKRNLLVYRFVRVIKEIEPWFFLLENVPGIKGGRGRKILDEMLGRLRRLGYVCHTAILDASDYAAPQRRKRFFVVGEKLPSGFSRFVFPKPVTPLLNQKLTVRQAIHFLPPPPADGSDHPQWPNHRCDKLSELNKKRLRALKPGEGRLDLPPHLLAACHKVNAEIMGHRNVYGRMRWDEVAPTITARFDSFTRGKFGHPVETRSISLREGAILQGFPKKFKFIGTKVSVARQIGNAVPPPLVEAIGRQIRIACEEELANQRAEKKDKRVMQPLFA